MSSLGALDPNGNLQIAATPLMPREKVTSRKLGKTRLRVILGVKMAKHSENRTSQR
jgi:hypothetical protein